MNDTNQQCFVEEALPHMDCLRHAALRMLRDRALAEDMVQETFKEALQSFHTYRPGSNCKAWLFRIFYRVRAKHFEKAKRCSFVSLEDTSESRFTSRDFLGALEARLTLNKLPKLPERYRSILILSLVENRTYRDIATSLGIPIGTVMSRLHRARKLFKKICSEGLRLEHQH